MPRVAPTVVILAAGQGTRMCSDLPKVLHPLCGRPMVVWPVAAALEAGAGRVVVIHAPGTPLGEFLPEGVEYAPQEQPLGTGDAVRAAAGAIERDTTVIVLSGDVPLVTADCVRELAEARESDGAAATVLTVELEDPSGYGRVVRAADGAVQRIVETKVAGDATANELAIREINTGIYAFDGGALLDALGTLEPANAQGEYYLPDVLPAMRDAGLAISAHMTDDAELVHGVNDRVDLAEVRAIAQARIHERHALAGVTIVDPASTVIDVDVAIGKDTVIAPSTFLRGVTEIGSHATVGPLTTVIDAKLGDEVSIVHSYLVGCEVHDARQRRAVRLPAPRHRGARGREGRHLRRGQELRHRRGHQGPAPLLPRRHRRGGGLQPRRRHDHRQLRRQRQAPDDDRVAGARRGGHRTRRACYGRR